MTKIFKLKQLYIVLLFLGFVPLFFAQSLISGIVSTEEGARIGKVIVINISTDQKTLTNDFGEYKICADYGQQIRFVKENFDRVSVIVDNNAYLNIVLIRMVNEIEAVEVSKLKITGNIADDASRVRINQSEEALRQAIGLPRGPENPREKAADAVDDILKPLIGIPPTIKIQAIYDVVSGRAKRMKRLYRYEDQQDYIAWIRSKIENDYFVSAGIPTEHINAFLLFSLADPKVLRYAKAKNTSGLIIAIEDNVPKFLPRISSTKD